MQEKARNHFHLPFKKKTKKKTLRISQAFLPTSVESCQHSHSTFKCRNLSNGLLQIFSPRLKRVHSFISLTHETMTLWIEPAPLFGIKSHEQKNLATLTTFKKLSKRKKMNGSLISIKGLQLVTVLSWEDKKHSVTNHSNRHLICTLTRYLLVNHVTLSHTFGRFCSFFFSDYSCRQYELMKNTEGALMLLWAQRLHYL